MGKDKLFPDIKKIQKKIKRQTEEIENLLREKRTTEGQRKLDRLSEFYQTYLEKLEPYLDLVAPGLLKKMESEIMTIIQTNESHARKINHLRQFDEKYRNKITKGLFKDKENLRTIYEDLSRMILPSPYESDLAGFFSPAGNSWYGEHRQNFFWNFLAEEAEPEEPVDCAEGDLRFAPPYFLGEFVPFAGANAANGALSIDWNTGVGPGMMETLPPMLSLGLSHTFSEEELTDPIYESFGWDVVYEVLVGIEVFDAEITGHLSGGVMAMEGGARVLVYKNPDVEQGLQCEDYKTIKRIDASTFSVMNIMSGPPWESRFITVRCRFVPKPDTQYQVRVIAEADFDVLALFAQCYIRQRMIVRCIAFQMVPAYLLLGG